MLEIDFIEKYKKQKPILLIDDLLSELDKEHKDLLLEKIENYQSFITSIRKDYN
jgi:recombinational DNA repair ATPase RecF